MRIIIALLFAAGIASAKPKPPDPDLSALQFLDGCWDHFSVDWGFALCWRHVDDAWIGDLRMRGPMGPNDHLVLKITHDDHLHVAVDGASGEWFKTRGAKDFPLTHSAKNRVVFSDGEAVLELKVDPSQHTLFFRPWPGTFGYDLRQVR